MAPRSQSSPVAQSGEVAPEAVEAQVDEILDADFAGIPLADLTTMTVSLAELGQTLPIGIFIDNERATEFELNPYVTRFDRELAEMMGPKTSMGKIFGNFFPRIVKSIGGFSPSDLAKKLSTSPARMFSSMYFGDVITILFRIRLAAVGENLALQAVCPNCGTENKDGEDTGYHDLSTVEVDYYPILKSPLEVEINLEDGIDDGAGHLIKRVGMKPMKLFDLDELGKVPQAKLDISMLYRMVSSLPDSKIYSQVKGRPFGDELYDNLTPRDLQILRSAINKLQPGPKLTIDMDCRNCGYTWSEAIPWRGVRDFLSLPVAGG
jgi:rubredoxin